MSLQLQPAATANSASAFTRQVATRILDQLSNASRKAVHWLFGLSLIAICAATALADFHAVHIWLMGHDFFFPVDNAWRMLHGQRPHADYYSPVGPLAFLPSAVGMWLSGGISGIRYGDGLWGLLLGLWSYRVLSRRMLILPAAAASLTLVLLALAPFAIGTGYLQTSHAMGYNRKGYAVLGLFILEIFQPPSRQKGQRSQEDLPGAMSSGAAAAVLLFLKVSFFPVALGLLALSAILFRQSRLRLAGLLGAFGVVSALVLAYLRFDVVAMWNDLAIAGGARGSMFGLSLLPVLTEAAIAVVPFLAFLVPAMLISETAHASDRLPEGLGWIKLGIPALAILAADIALRTVNTQPRGVPLACLMVVLIGNAVLTNWRESSAKARESLLPFAFAMVTWGLILGVQQPLRDAAGVVWAATRPAPASRSVTLVESDKLARLRLHDGETLHPNNGTLYAEYLNDGMALLRKLSPQHEPVLTVDFTNPFPYALGRKPMAGGAAALAYGFMLSENSKPSDDRLIGNAKAVMVPKTPTLSTKIVSIFRPILDKHFHLAGESRYWYLYRQN